MCFLYHEIQILKEKFNGALMINFFKKKPVDTHKASNDFENVS